MKKISIFALTLLFIGALAYVFSGKTTVTKLLPDRPQLAPGVAMQDVTFYSAALGRQMPYRVFLPEKLARSVDPVRTPYLYLTAGENEPLLAPNRRFAALLKICGFAYEFHTKPGSHDWGEWDAQIPGCFESLVKHLKPGR